MPAMLFSRLFLSRLTAVGCIVGVTACSALPEPCFTHLLLHAFVPSVPPFPPRPALGVDRPGSASVLALGRPCQTRENQKHRLLQVGRDVRLLIPGHAAPNQPANHPTNDGPSPPQIIIRHARKEYPPSISLPHQGAHNSPSCHLACPDT